MRIILASSSPRRRQLLEQIGVKFEIVFSDVEEDNAKNMPPQELVVAHARDKAKAVQTTVLPNDIIIGADTIVVLDDKIFGKPSDKAEACQMLMALSGREHIVISGVAVLKGSQVWTGYAATQVRIRQLSTAEVERYVATGEPMDKAGAYAIQGRGTLLVESINGCYTNVVGLPLVTLSKLLKQAGISLL